MLLLGLSNSQFKFIEHNYLLYFVSLSTLFVMCLHVFKTAELASVICIHFEVVWFLGVRKIIYVNQK